MTTKIDRFIEDLRSEETIENTANPFSDAYEYSQYTRHNLKLYLENCFKNNSKVLFLGEAPGHKGCRLSGVPFTSEKILVSPSLNQIVGDQFDYHIRDRENPQTESSATIIWSGFEKHSIYPVMWNAFPFHPYKSGNTESNRAPNKVELLVGVAYIKRLIEIFEIEKVYAIGNVAYNTLTSLGLTVDKIRHPSMGGKTQFLEGLASIKN